MHKRLNWAVMIAVCVFALAGCTTTPNDFGYGDPVPAATPEDRMQAAVRNAAIEAQKGHLIAGELRLAGEAYRADPSNPALALDYARALRLAGMTGQAQMILRPVAIDPARATPDVLTEYAKIRLLSGDFEGAQIYAQEAMVLSPDDAEAFHTLGIAVDAQGHHQAAENHFRKALDLTVPNTPMAQTVAINLALSLAAQGKVNEAQNLVDGMAFDSTPRGMAMRDAAAFINDL